MESKAAVRMFAMLARCCKTGSSGVDVVFGCRAIGLLIRSRMM